MTGVFEALATCYVAVVRAMVDSPAENAGRAADCSWGRTPVAISDMNRVMLPRLDASGDRLAERLVEIETRFDGLPHSWWLDPGASPPDLEGSIRWLAPRASALVVPAMALDLAAALPDEEPAGIEVTFAVGARELVAAGELAARGFGLRVDESAGLEPLFERVGRDPDTPVRVAVGRLAGQPVATALGCLAGDLLGVYNVATLPTARRRGLGRVVTRAVLRDGAARGARQAVLESSQAGRALYHQLGFREAGLFTVVSVPGERA